MAATGRGRVETRSLDALQHWALTAVHYRGRLAQFIRAKAPYWWAPSESNKTHSGASSTGRSHCF
jgi:hypothetical protein